ncbi:patatin-like phospholipase family protein [Candidatus Moduliflexus flocculans]|uniref:Patatin-like phospholipase family protein n=1 Tax=Candidatus Moduliflexus flocculans TaxID=1499966 RepID=A0A0S6VYG6_9BACT|nr:patatin-like phospholipase family protein [Candidatus Moduliflexus flocculans]
MSHNTTVSLVLGSGGARGLAHIGIIHWLEEHGYQIHSISGCSMGALVGGIYAAGKLDAFEQWVRSITKFDILTYMDFSFSKSGFVKGGRLMKTLSDLVGDRQIETLPIRFTAVATDIEHSKEIWLNSGSLFDAVRASISIPLLFTPFFYRDAFLIDGGILNPVPIAPTFHDNTDLTIAVNLSARPKDIREFLREETHAESTEEPSNFSAFQKKIGEFLALLQFAKSEQTVEEIGMYEVAVQAFDAMQEAIARQKLAAYPPDFVVEIARNACGTLEFDLADQMIALGYEKAREYLGMLAPGATPDTMLSA